jgi:serine/threonine-protein kinase
MEPTALLTPPPAPRPPEEPPPRREWWPWLLVFCLLVLAGIAAAWYATRDSSSASAAPTTQLTTVAAPKPNSTKQQTTAPAVVEVAVPGLVGQKRGDAVRTLEAAGLAASVNEVPSDEGKDIVVAQAPAGGEQAVKGASVTLNVSKGRQKPIQPATVTVPDVVGQSKDHAQSAIKDAGLRPSTQHVPSNEPEGTVVSQSPSAGSSAQQGAGVLLNISTGPPKPEKTKPGKRKHRQAAANTTVPSVVGESEATATSHLQMAGFTVSTVDQGTDDPSSDGVVIDQSPAGGSDAAADSDVSIYVGRYSTG